MRLYNTIYICRTFLPYIKEVKVEAIPNNGNCSRISGWKNCKKALEAFLTIDCLKEKVDIVYKTLDAYERSLVDLVLSNSKKTTFMNSLNKLIISVETLINLGESLEFGESIRGIDIKIPKSESLGDFISILKDLDFVFSQCPFLIYDEERIKFDKVDVGSQWLSFFVDGMTTCAILSAFGKLVQKAVEIRSNLILCKQQEEILKQQQLKSNIEEEVINVFKIMKSKVLGEAVNSLEGDINQLKDGEERGKVEKTLEKLGELIDKGVEIYASIDTPQEVKTLFPSKEDNKILTDDIIKFIEKK